MKERRNASAFHGKVKNGNDYWQLLSQFSTSLMIMILYDNTPICGLQNLKHLPAEPLRKKFSHS